MFHERLNTARIAGKTTNFHDALLRIWTIVRARPVQSQDIYGAVFAFLKLLENVTMIQPSNPDTKPATALEQCSHYAISRKALKATLCWTVL